MAVQTRMQRCPTVKARCQQVPFSSTQCTMRAPPRRETVQQAPSMQLLQQIASSATTAALAVSLALTPMGAAQAAAPTQLADLLREQFGFVDTNKDGLVTKSELQQLVKTISAENNVPLIDTEQLDFSMKLFDLNQDGNLTTEELLRSLVLDGAVSEDAVDADVFAVFDK
eukprot:GHUV01022366.1.p1 GENE.GHUV01022366.1~~GHUV01022366.1.p1  ORF type:complete len:199 (+),score=63.38 GHUV01022366.1:90-599(+)